MWGDEEGFVAIDRWCGVNFVRVSDVTFLPLAKLRSKKT